MTTNNDPTILGNNLRLLRERDRLTVKEMAEIMRISTANYEQLEQGILPKRVTVDCIFFAADYFSLSPANLFNAQEATSTAQ